VAAPLVDGNGVTLKLCAAPGCYHRAIVFPELVIPPVGHPHTRGLKINIGLALCRKHGLEEKPETFLTDQLRNMASTLVKPSPIPLDFDRARINLKPIGGEDWNKSVGIAREAQAARYRRLNS
jgi:hypothetical protein